MKEQHKAMMRRLKSGEFDERAFPSQPASGAADFEPAALPCDAADESDLATPADSQAAPFGTDRTSPPEAAATSPEPAAADRDAGPDKEPDAGQDGSPMELVSLDDAILAFFAAHEK